MIQHLLLLFFLIAFQCVACKNCTKQVLRGGEDIDWKNVPNGWYLTMNTFSQITDDLPCVTIRNVSSPDYQNMDATFVLENFYSNRLPFQFKLHVQGKGDGKYLYVADSDLDVYFATSIKGNGKFNMEAAQETSEMLQTPRLTITDYETYLIMVVCLENENLLVWAFTRTTRPSQNVRNEIANQLKKKGINSVHLNDSSCDEVLIK
uniref:uncharacterized protein LOC120338402 isoform X1 n=1 Tax=Styela clava TaxID=7725 RepID=UPI001939CAA8|nr:uncharacterized protein LOC120338402 isoform X1 [Styela clava]